MRTGPPRRKYFATVRGGNPDSQQLQFVGDAFLSPRGILRRHLADQRLEVVGQARSACRLRLPTPEEAESLAVPTQERVRLPIHQRVPPSEPLTQSRHHPAGGSVGPSRPDLPLLEEGQLLSQKQVLGHQRRPRTCGEGNQSDQVDGNHDNVRRQCTTARKLTGLDMDHPGSHVTKRYQACPCGSDEIFADHSLIPHGRSFKRR